MLVANVYGWRHRIEIESLREGSECELRIFRRLSACKKTQRLVISSLEGRPLLLEQEDELIGTLTFKASELDTKKRLEASEWLHQNGVRDRGLQGDLWSNLLAIEEGRIPVVGSVH